jgi:glyoxylate/hydroxypyruvate reductase
MSILVLSTSRFVALQEEALRTTASRETIYTDPLTAPTEKIEAILAFRLPRDIIARFPNLRFVACAGAGADELIGSLGRVTNVPVVRPIDPLQGRRMAQYVALMLLRWHRELDRYQIQQRAIRWERHPPESESHYAVGVMGYGNIAAPVVEAVQALGYPTRIWARSPRTIPGIAAFAGRTQLAEFLAATRVLICALPLTQETRGLLDADLFAALPRGAYVVNVSRGPVLREDDLLGAVDSGHLESAALDVFAEEPLPAHSALWRHAKIVCTPHIAATPRPEIAAAQLLENLHRARAGEPLLRQVDLTRGY